MDQSLDNISQVEETEYKYIDKKLWNPKGFIFIGVIFSFLPAAVLYSLNYGRVGQKKERMTNLLGFIVLFIAVSTLTTFIGNNIAKSLFFGLNIGLSIYMRNKQTELFHKHIESGGKKASYLLPVIISVIFTGLILWAMIYTINIPDQSLKVYDDELFYTERVTAAEVNDVGEFLKSVEFFGNDNVTINAGIDKDQNGYIFSFLVNDEAVDDAELAEYMKEISTLMSQEVFGNQRVQVNLCDENFKVLKTIQ